MVPWVVLAVKFGASELIRGDIGLHEQRDGFYAKGQIRHELVVSRLKMISLGLAVLGLVFGAVSAYFPDIGLARRLASPRPSAR